MIEMVLFNSVQSKRLLVLGGTRISCEIIRQAKKMGVVVGVADYNSIENSPGKQIADETYAVSVLDTDAVVSIIKEYKFDGVLTGFSDMLLPYYAEICEKAGLPSYGTKEQFEVFIDKKKYKKLCREHNVPTVEEYVIDSSDKVINPDSIIYPVLVKPSDSSGSRGISICESYDELNAAIAKSRAYSKTGEILIERYLTGKEVTVFWLFIDGKYYLSAIGNRHVKQNQGDDVIPLPVGYTYPAAIVTEYRSKIEENAKRMFKSLDIKNGMMFMQCKVENDECIVYDIGYRLTGSLEYINLQQVCGYNPLEMLVYFALTGKMVEDSTSLKINAETMPPSFNVSCLAKPGIIAEINGCDAVKQLPEVADVVIAHLPGEEITENMRGLLAQITVRVLGCVSDKKDLYPTMHKIENMIHIVSTTGDEMRLPGIEESDITGMVN